jgi:hypothetical protein
VYRKETLEDKPKISMDMQKGSVAECRREKRMKDFVNSLCNTSRK